MKASKILPGIAAATLLLGFMAWLSGMFNDKIAPGQIRPGAEPVHGAEFEVRQTSEATFETATGTINARDETVVSSRILASIRQLNVRAGDTVKQDAVLAELDDRELRARVEQASQSVLAARALLEESRADFQRIKSIYEKQLASRAQFDQAEASLKAKTADYQRSQQQHEEAKTALSYTTIKSPIDGKVIERYADPGDTASPGRPLLKIYNPALLRLDAQVRESLAAGIRIGDRLRARIDALDREVPVVIDEIVPSADPGSRSITVKALLSADSALVPGMFGRLLIPTGETQRLYIPGNAVSRVGQLEFVEVLEDGVPVRRFIRSGQAGIDGQVDVLSGLKAGEVIVLPAG